MRQLMQSWLNGFLAVLYLLFFSRFPQLLSCWSSASHGFQFEIDDGSSIIDPTLDFELSSMGTHGDKITLIIPANTLPAPLWVRLRAEPPELIAVQKIIDRGY